MEVIAADVQMEERGRAKTLRILIKMKRGDILDDRVRVHPRLAQPTILIRKGNPTGPLRQSAQSMTALSWTNSISAMSPKVPEA